MAARRGHQGSKEIFTRLSKGLLKNDNIKRMWKGDTKRREAGTRAQRWYSPNGCGQIIYESEEMAARRGAPGLDGDIYSTLNGQGAFKEWIGEEDVKGYIKPTIDSIIIMNLKEENRYAKLVWENSLRTGPSIKYVRTEGWGRGGGSQPVRTLMY